MKLIYEEEIPESRVLRTFGTNPWPNVVFFLATALAITYGGKWVYAGVSVPVWMWLVLAPIGLVMALVLLLLISALPHAVVAGFKSSNWYLKIASDGLYVKIRSYLNYHFPDDTPTIAFLPYNEIESLGCLTWQMSLRVYRQQTSRREKNLIVRPKDVSTKLLRKAVREERNRKAPKRGFSALKFGDQPMRVQKDGAVLIRWPLFSAGPLTKRREERLLDFLSKYANVERRHEIVSNVGGDLADGQQNDDLILQLVERGEIVNAVLLVRSQYGFSTTEAKQFVESLAVADECG